MCVGVCECVCVCVCVCRVRNPGGGGVVLREHDGTYPIEEYKFAVGAKLRRIQKPHGRHI